MGLRMMEGGHPTAIYEAPWMNESGQIQITEPLRREGRVLRTVLLVGP